MGADNIYVKKLLQEPLLSEKLIADAIMNAEVFYDKFGVICLREDQKIPDRTTLAKISDKMLTIQGVEASFTIGYIESNLIGISARSLGDSINVQLIMELMGGGGHFNSAACQLKDRTIESIKAELIEQIREEYVDKNDASLTILLLEDVKGKGKKDDVITVSLNLANKLIQDKKAEEASEDALKKLKDKKNKEKQQEVAHKDILSKFKDEISGKTINIKLQKDNNGKVTHITKTKICEEFMKQTGITLNRNKIELPGDIVSRGIYTINVKLDADITASFAIKVEDGR